MGTGACGQYVSIHVFIVGVQLNSYNMGRPSMELMYYCNNKYTLIPCEIIVIQYKSNIVEFTLIWVICGQGYVFANE